MRNPELLNKVDNIYKDNGKTTIEIKSVPVFDLLQYDLFNDKDFTHYIRDIERTVRNSFEYRQLIAYLKNTEGMDECSFLENVSSRDNKKVRIELHHEPLSLYDICMAVFKKRQAMREDTRVESIAEEVMYLHYLGWVGLIPLSATIHELVHNQYLFIPLDKVRGMYQEFVKAYYNYIEPETLDCLDACEEATREYDAAQMKILNHHSIYINTDASRDMITKKDIVNAMIKNRINTIKNGTVLMATIVK